MAKHIARDDHRKARKETPFVVWLWVMGFGFISYMVARIGLSTSPHPIHWASGLVGAVVGYGIGWLWYHWRGDVF